MTTATHLWAIGYDDMGRADEVREVVSNLAWDAGQVSKALILQDIAVVVGHPDGSFTFDRTRFPGVANILGCTTAGFLAGLVLAGPLAGAAIGALVGCLGSAASAAAVGIPEDFVREVQGLMKPGTSVLFVLDDAVDEDVILHTIRGLGGTVLKTDMDLDRAKLIQSTLAGASNSHQ